jgi:hypothetical protein
VKGEVSTTIATAQGKQEWGSPHARFTAEEKLTIGASLSGEAGLLVDKSKQNPKLIAHMKGEGKAGEQASLSGQGAVGKHVSTAGKGEINSGAWGSAGATVALDPRHGTMMGKLGASGFAGAEEKIQGEVKVGWVRVSAGVGTKQGVGGDFQFGAGMKDGRVGLDIDAGAAVGCGGSLAFGMSLNTKAMAKKAAKGFLAMKKHFRHTPSASPAAPSTTPSATGPSTATPAQGTKTAP